MLKSIHTNKTLDLCSSGRGREATDLGDRLTTSLDIGFNVGGSFLIFKLNWLSFIARSSLELLRFLVTFEKSLSEKETKY